MNHVGFGSCLSMRVIVLTHVRGARLARCQVVVASLAEVDFQNLRLKTCCMESKTDLLVVTGPVDEQPAFSWIQSKGISFVRLSDLRSCRQ